MKVPNKIYISPANVIYPGDRQDERDIEYIRTDAFIEKATWWLLTNANDYVVLHNYYDTKELVKDFVDAMKRE